MRLIFQALWESLKKFTIKGQYLFVKEENCDPKIQDCHVNVLGKVLYAKGRGTRLKCGVTHTPGKF